MKKFSVPWKRKKTLLRKKEKKKNKDERDRERERDLVPVASKGQLHSTPSFTVCLSKLFLYDKYLKT